MHLTEKEGKALMRKLGIKTKDPTFDSAGERIYYESTVLPALKSGEIKSCDVHRTFVVIPKVVFAGKTYRERKFTPDFFLEYPDGKVKIVEVKSGYVRRAQRDYPLRRQLFLQNFCVPNGWEYEEVDSDVLSGRKK